MGILPLKKCVNRDKCSFGTKQRMFRVFAIDEILRYRGTRFPGSRTLCHPVSSTFPSAECYRNFLRPRKHNVPSCSSAPPELGTAPNFLPSTKPAPPSKPTTYNPALYFPPSPSVAAVSHSREILSPLLTSKLSHSIRNGHWRDISSHWTNYVP